MNIRHDPSGDFIENTPFLKALKLTLDLHKEYLYSFLEYLFKSIYFFFLPAIDLFLALLLNFKILLKRLLCFYHLHLLPTV